MTPASLPSLIPNSSSLSSQFADGDEVSVSDPHSYYIFTEFGHWFSQFRVRQPGGFPGEENSIPMGNSLSPQIQCAPSIPYDSSLHDGLSPIHSHESRISSGFFDSVRERNAGGDYPVRPRGNPQPQGVLLSIYFNAY